MVTIDNQEVLEGTPWKSNHSAELVPTFQFPCPKEPISALVLDFLAKKFSTE